MTRPRLDPTIPQEFTFLTAVRFMEQRGCMRLEDYNEVCPGHQRTHAIWFWDCLVGVHRGFDTEREVIDWVQRLAVNAI